MRAALIAQNGLTTEKEVVNSRAPKSRNQGRKRENQYRPKLIFFDFLFFSLFFFLQNKTTTTTKKKRDIDIIF